MDVSPRTRGRALPWLGVLITLEAVVGFLPRLWSIEPELNSLYPTAWFQLVLNLVLLLLGLGTLLARAKAPGPETSRHIVLGSFFCMTLMTIGACVILGRLGDVPHLLRPLGWLLADIGAAGLWGSALTRMEDPSNPRSKTSGRSYAAIAGAAYIATTIPEISSIVESLQFRRAFNDQSVLVNLILIPARFCLLWCAIQPFRSYADDGAIRRSALATHHIMIVWFLLSLLGGGWMLLAFSPMGSGSRGGGWGETAGLWRLATHYTLLATAVVAVGLSQETPDRSTTSTHPVFPDL